MKLHLPSKLRHAVLACMSAMVGIASTCATGSLVAGVLASQALAQEANPWQATDWENSSWDGMKDNDHANANVTIHAGEQLSINKWSGDPSKSDGPTTGAGNTSYNESYKLGTITVEVGGQLWFNIHNQKVPLQSNFKQMAGSLTLKGQEFYDAFDEYTYIETDKNGVQHIRYYTFETATAEMLRDRATLVLQDGSHLFQDAVKVDGYAYVFSTWGGSQTFTNLSSVNDDSSDILEFQPNITENARHITYTLAYNKDEPINAFNGTIIINYAIDDRSVLLVDDLVSLTITNQNVVGMKGQGATYQLNDAGTALFLGAANLYIPNIDARGGDVVSKQSGAQVRQTIGRLIVEGEPDSLTSKGHVELEQDDGTTAWTINGIEGDGYVLLNEGTESFKPHVIYLNTANITEKDENDNVTKAGFTGELTLGGYTYAPDEQYGVYAAYVEVGHPYALAEATLNLSGEIRTFTYVSEEGMLDNDNDYQKEHHAILAMNATDVYVGALTGSVVGSVVSGRAPITGTEDDPSTAIRPESSAASRTLHVGSIRDEGTIDYFYGEILKNVNLMKEGDGNQVIYNMENDPSRYINVKSGVLTLGSIGDFRRLSVDLGARAEVGLSVSSEVNHWGVGQKFVYYSAFDNGVDLSDSTKVSGNVVLTDELYRRHYSEDWDDDTIVVTHLDATNYSQDSLTLVGADLAVFDPATGLAANLGNIKTISFRNAGALVSASPQHHYNMSDPNIVVSADLAIENGEVGRFIAYGSLYRSDLTNELTFVSNNTTYTGRVYMQATDPAETYAYGYIYKDGFGQITLAGDMSDYNQRIQMMDGTVTLSGSHGKIKNFSDIYMLVQGMSVLEVTDGAEAKTEKLRSSSYKVDARSYCTTDVYVAAGSTLSITGENTDLNDDADDKPAAYSIATFLVSNGTHMAVEVDGTFNMTRASFLSVTPVHTRFDGVGKKEININSGGVFNAKGLWLQSYSTEEAITTTVNIRGGATLNIGEEGLGHADVSGSGAVKADTNNHLVLNFEDGATLGVLNDTAGWSTMRSITLQGGLTVNTQGYVVEEGSTANGNAKTITLGEVYSAPGSKAAIVKDGAGTLELGAGSNVTSALVRNGYLAVKHTDNNYSVSLGTVKTETNGALLFDLEVAKPLDDDYAVGQPYVAIDNKVDGVLNITVRAGEGNTNMNGKTYAILRTNPPRESQVNLVAMVDDGWYAEYDDNQDAGWGYVTITYDASKLLGNNKVLTWATTAGDSNFWGNSTEKNWQDTANGATRRFTNGSCVEFSQAGETVTLLGTVQVADQTINGTNYAAMAVKATGYEFTGQGAIESDTGTLKVADNVHVTFSNTGDVKFGNGVELGNGATIRLEYLTDDSSNWDARIAGNGTLEIATGGNRTNVLDSVMGDTVNTVSLDNKTTLTLDAANPGEANKLAAAQNVVVKDASRINIATGSVSTLLASGQKLYLAGDGVVEDTAATEAALSVINETDATIQADVVLNADATVYVAGLNSLIWNAGYDSNGKTLTKNGVGTLKLSTPDSDAKPGLIHLKQGILSFDWASNQEETLANHVKMENATQLQFYDDTVVTGGIDVNAAVAYMNPLSGAVVQMNSAMTSSDRVDLQIVNSGGGYLVLNVANPDYDGTFTVRGGKMQANHTNALQNATVAGIYSSGYAVLELGSAATMYNADGLEGHLSVASADGQMRTIRLTGNDVYSCSGKLGKNVSIIQDGRGAQRYTGISSFEDGYNGNITVKRGLLQFYIPPTGYGTIELAGDEAQLNMGYPDYNTPGANGEYLAGNLWVRNGQTLLITETGAVLNANLLPASGGQITLGTEANTWTAEGGLNLFGQSLQLDTADKAALTVNLSAFLKAGDYVELFTHVGELTIDGVQKDFLSDLGLLEDYFDCDDINLARTKLELTAAGTIRIKLVNDSDGQYYEYQGGTDGVWDYSTQAWSLKDDKEARHKYAGGAAYFTNNTATVTLAEDIEAREMAVKNGNYTFVLEDGNDLTIRSRYYEMEDGVATFVLEHAESTDANGNPVSEGAKLNIRSGMGDIDNTVVRGDGDTSNQLILGSKTALSGNSKFEDVYLFLDGENSKLDLGGTSATNVHALGGEGTISANYGGLTISNKMNGTFVGSFVAGAENSAPGVNTLVIEEGDATKLQTFSNVTIDKSWNLVNNGSLDFKPTAESELNSLALGAASKTTLTLNTDQKQLLGLTALAVEDGADITLNSIGNAPIMSGEQTPGYSYKVLGSFEDDGSLDIAGDAVTINRGSGTAFLMVDKSEPITLKSVYNQETGHYDLVMVAKVDDSNQFAPYAEGEPNAEAGAEMLWTQEGMTYINAEPNGDLAKTFNEIATMVTSTAPNGEQIREALASVAGSSTAVLGSAFSADVERQLKAIRNRTTTMGVGQCEVNENMPYYNAWINAEGNHRELDSDGLAAGYTHDSWGGTVGFDVDVTPSFTWGLALTAMYGDIETEGADKGEGDFDTMYLSAFARYAKNAWVHTFVATVGRADVTLSRTVNVGSTSYETEGETDGMAFGFMYEVGRVYALSEDGSTCWQPMFNVALRNSSISGYDEECSDAGLSVGDQDFTTLTFGVGARLQTVMGENLYNRSSIFEARALLKFDAGDTEAETETALLNGNGVAQTVEGAEVGAFGVEIGAGVTIPVGAEGGAVFLDASAELRSGYTNINGTLGYRVNF